MKVSELRIGNLVMDCHTGKECSVDAIDLYGVAFTEDKLYDDYQRTIQPTGIPLTEEWLLKFGFGKSDDEECGCNTDKNFGFYYDWHFKRFNLQVDDGANVVDVSMDIHYVHQLQNLYFALTGEELTIKE